MNKNELISKIATEAESTKKAATQITEAVFEVIGDAIVEGEKIQIPNFGTFSSKETAARVCKNPQTGKKIEVPASRKVCFKPSSILRAAVKGE